MPETCSTAFVALGGHETGPLLHIFLPQMVTSCVCARACVKLPDPLTVLGHLPNWIPAPGKEQSLPHVREIKSDRHLEIQLNGTTLVITAQSIFDLNINLRRSQRNRRLSPDTWLQFALCPGRLLCLVQSRRKLYR